MDKMFSNENTRLLKKVPYTVKPVCNDGVYKDKSAYNDIFFGTGGIPIYSLYSDPAYSDNHFLDAPVCYDNFTFLRSWMNTDEEPITKRRRMTKERKARWLARQSQESPDRIRAVNAAAYTRRIEAETPSQAVITHMFI
ncbi:hypothetical protein AVEN_217610-1 [Araneus ventricosus]|uniref:Uncharacterized protein n=1 Tax=Araneus ventricosus TaxID=182803 RepID=A0A4Y2FHV4_ARAVE|nr:hypothetical protein AVEN_217610-1 [Araneus ventricosus]